VNKLIYSLNYGDGNTSLYKMEATNNGINDCRIKMSFSENDVSWSPHIRGQVAAELKDHGNGVKIKLQRGTKIKLDYDEITELAALFKFYEEDSGAQQFVTTITKFKEVE